MNEKSPRRLQHLIGDKLDAIFNGGVDDRAVGETRVADCLFVLQLLQC